MYKTKHTDKQSLGRINYVVWSDIFICSTCQNEIVFWIEAVEHGSVKDNIVCPKCNTILKKNLLERATTTIFDYVLDHPIKKAKRIPTIINYSIGNNRFEKEPDEDDFKILTRIEDEPIPEWYPTDRIDKDIDLWYERDYRSLGIYSIDAFFTKRNLIMVSFFRKEIFNKEERLRSFL
jgi:DNA-directed RNA polymerase subunit RPC12/RpoP